MKKLPIILVFVCLLCMLLPAALCEENTVTVTDCIGREVEVTPGSYGRVVCIGAGALRMYSYIADPALLCGVEDIDNLSLADRPKMFDGAPRPYVLAYGDVFATLPSCGVGGPNAQTAEAEKILTCAPDLVISEYHDVEKADALQEQLGVPVLTLRSGSGVFDPMFFECMTLLGKVFGEEEKAEALISYIEAEKAELSARTSDIPDAEKPGVYICGLGNWGTTDHLQTAESYPAFAAANVKNVMSGLGLSGMQKIEEEKFIEVGESMDVMIVDAAAVKNIAPLFRADETMFDTCRAWREGNVYLQMAYNSYYTNYEITLMNAWFIAKTVYPDRFADVDMTEKTNEITTVFLGKPLASEIFACPSGFGGYGRLTKELLLGE